MEGLLLTAFVVVWLGLAVGSWLFSRSLTPPLRRYWHPRLTLIAMACMLPFFLVPFLVGRDWGATILVVTSFALMTWLGLTRVRVCESCGKTAQPQSFFRAAEFCPRCGNKVTTARLSDPRPCP